MIVWLVVCQHGAAQMIVHDHDDDDDDDDDHDDPNDNEDEVKEEQANK